MKKLLSSLLIIMSSMIATSTLAVNNDERIDTILSQLTLEEKAGQLNLIPIEGEPSKEHIALIKAGKVGSVLKANGVANNLALQKLAVEHSRAGIPLLFQEDVIHGYRTIAPVPLAEAASWDLDAIEASAAVAAREASAAGIHLTYAPMVDVSRDPRWGRIIEAAGEDPYLGSLISAARVRGFQQGSEDPNLNLLATVKHFAGYGASLAGRDYNIRDISERELREVHLPPFKAAIDAGVSSVMGAYTAYDGVPATADAHLMQNILRGELKFGGLLMTDWETIPNLVKIGVAKNNSEAVIQAMKAGFDIDMTSQQYVEQIPKLVRQGKISEDSVDNAVRQVLRLKQRIGILDDPYARLNLAREKQQLLSAQNWQDTKDIARKSIVLLKNQNKLLPIREDIKRIAIIGPMAKAKKDLLGWWHAKGKPDDVVTIYDGLKAALPNDVSLTYAPGIVIDKFKKVGAELIPQAVELATQADLVILAIGEEWWMSGEGGGTASLHLPSLQEELTTQLSKTGTPIVSLVVTGRPYILTDIAKHSDALLQTWMLGTTSGEAIAEVLLGKFNPQGRLPVTFPRHQGQVPIYHSYKKTSHAFDPGLNDNRYTTSYRDISIDPLYPFGFGLSYTDFVYGDIRLDKKAMSMSETITASMELTNKGKRTGTETVQLYLRDKVASVTRPIMALKGFKQVSLEPGETKNVEFFITPDLLSYLNRDFRSVIETGQFELMIGPNAANVKRIEFTLQ